MQNGTFNRAQPALRKQSTMIKIEVESDNDIMFYKKKYNEFAG